MNDEKALEELENSPYVEAMAIAMLLLHREETRRPGKVARYRFLYQQIVNTLGDNKILLKKYLSSIDGYYFQYDESEAYLAGIQSQKNGLPHGLGLIMHLYDMQNNEFVQKSRRRAKRYAMKLRQALGRKGVLLDEFTHLYQIFHCSSRAKAKYLYNLGYHTNRERNV